MIKLQQLREWIFIPEPIGTLDKLAIYSAKIEYLLIRLLLKIFLSKKKRTKFWYKSNFRLGRLIPHNSWIKYDGFLFLIRAREDDINNFLPSNELTIKKIISELNEDDNFVDVGANIGKYVILASNQIKKGRIIALEPNPETFSILKENCQANNLEIECIDIAASDTDGTSRLYVGKWGSRAYSMERLNSKFIDIKTKTIDSLISELGLKKIDWMLIDVEGAESKVLDGIKNGLRIIKNIIIEIHSDENYTQVTKILKENNFKVTNIEDGYDRFILGTHGEIQTLPKNQI